MRRLPVLAAAVAFAVCVNTASASAMTRPAFVPGLDVVTVAQARALSGGVAAQAAAAAQDAGGSSAAVVDGTIGMLALRRGTGFIQETAKGWRIPMTFTALDAAAAGVLYGSNVGDQLNVGKLVMGTISAGVRGAQVGDEVTLLGWNGHTATATVGVISDQSPSELMIPQSLADALGATRLDRVVIWGFVDRDALAAALAAHGLPSAVARVTDSWDPSYSDDTLSQSRQKALAGEFAVQGYGVLRLPPTWVSANIPTVRLKIGRGTYLARCHRVIEAPLMAVFDDINAAGLAGLIARRGVRSTVGCWSAREIRSLGSTTGGSISRHTWATAVDFNVAQNCIGCIPKLDCRIVQIFRSHGFAWGGNFLTPDGMHFEYVGEPRDHVPVRPGGFCPTSPPPPPDPPSS